MKVKAFIFNRFVLIVAVIYIIGCNSSVDEPPANAESVIVPDRLHMSDLKGQPIDMQQIKGKALFINYWATWCKPCIEEMPSIANAQKLLSDKVIFIMASPESSEEIESFRIKNPYPFLFTRIENMESLGITALPTTFIFSSKGELVFSESGARKWDDSVNINLIHQIVNND